MIYCCLICKNGEDIIYYSKRAKKLQNFIKKIKGENDKVYFCGFPKSMVKHLIDNNEFRSIK